MWRSVSAAHGVIEERRREWENTEPEDRLAEQLSLLPMLHDWHAVTENEAHELSYLLHLYCEPAADATREEVARAVNDTVRRMAARRGSAVRTTS
jgi:hypothetical protein